MDNNKSANKEYELNTSARNISDIYITHENLDTECTTLGKEALKYSTVNVKMRLMRPGNKEKCKYSFSKK